MRDSFQNARVSANWWLEHLEGSCCYDISVENWIFSSSSLLDTHVGVLTFDCVGFVVEVKISLCWLWVWCLRGSFFVCILDLFLQSRHLGIISWNWVISGFMLVNRGHVSNTFEWVFVRVWQILSRFLYAYSSSGCEDCPVQEVFGLWSRVGALIFALVFVVRAIWDGAMWSGIGFAFIVQISAMYLVTLP